MSNRPQNPYDFLPRVPAFKVESDTIEDGKPMQLPHASDIFGAGGQDLSPDLRWAGFPPETKSFVVTCFDPDAPTGGGFWHWAALNLPPTLTELPTGAGTHGGPVELPDSVIQLKNDAGTHGYVGAAPPIGHGPHRYFFAVHALSRDSLPLDESASPAVCGFNMFGNTLARALIVPTYER